MKGIHSSPRNTIAAAEIRPTRTSCCSLAVGRIFRYTSHVRSVEHALNAEASELISAASIPASTSPLAPSGKSRVTSVGYAESGFEWMSVNSAAATTPGRTKMNTGRILR